MEGGMTFRRLVLDQVLFYVRARSVREGGRLRRLQEGRQRILRLHRWRRMGFDGVHLELAGGREPGRRRPCWLRRSSGGDFGELFEVFRCTLVSWGTEVLTGSDAVFLDCAGSRWRSAYRQSDGWPFPMAGSDEVGLYSPRRDRG